MPHEPSISLAYERFDAANAKDPNTVITDGMELPKELVFARRLTDEILALNPEAPVALRLASRCQHIRRWEIPRDTQPMGRAGYLKWRAELKKFHAEKSAEILREVGYDECVIKKVQDLNLKKNLHSDPDCQTLEDALCLVFLKYQFDALIENTEEEKMALILQKTWAKMSEMGQKFATQLDYSERAAEVLEKSLSDA